MAVVGYATIQLIPSLQGFSGQVNKQITPAASAAGARAGRESGSTFSGGFIGAVGKIAAAAGIYSSISAITTGFRNAVQTGLEGVANLQSYSISFETLLGSASKAKDMIASLYDFAAKTPFDVEGSVVGAQKLLGVGVAAKDVVPTLTTLGDATAALGGSTESFNAVLLAYSQIMARGKVSTQDLYQISNTGIPIFQLLSKALGKPVGEIQKLIETGKLASSDVLPKLLAVMNQDYGGAMSKQAKTLGGLFSTFKDDVEQALTQAMTPAAEWFQSILPQATTVATGAIRGFGDRIGGIFKYFQDNKATFDDAFKPFKQILEDTDWSTLLGNVAKGNQGVADSLAPIIKGVGDVLAPIIPPLVDSLNKLTASAPPAGTAVEGAGGKMGLQSQAADNAAGANQRYAASASPIVNQMQGLQVVLDATAKYISPVVGGINQFGNALVENGSVSKTWSQAIRGDFGQAVQGITFSLDLAFKSIGAFFIRAGVTIGAGIHNFVFTIQTGMARVPVFFATTFAQIGSTIAAGMTAAVVNARAGVNNVIGVFKGIGNSLIESGRSLIDGFGRGIRQGIENAVAAAGEAVGRVRALFPFSPAKTGPFSGKGWTLYSGRSLVDGFSTGIADRQRSLARVMASTFTTPSIAGVNVGEVTGGGVRGALADAVTTASTSGAYIGSVNFSGGDRSAASMIQDLNFYLRSLDRGGR